MDEYRKILIDLVQKCKKTLINNPDYIMCSNLLKKINESIINDNPDSLEIDYEKISSISKEEISLFSSSNCERIIHSLPYAMKKDGIKKSTILMRIKELETDLINNRLKSFDAQIKRLDLLLDAINNNIYVDNYKLILDFIELSLNNNLIDITMAINLNFYVLRKYNSYSFNKNKEESFEVVRLIENNGSIDENRSKLKQIFNKYGYEYAICDLDKCGGEEEFVKYADIGYVDYVLAKFKRYGITQRELYAKKTFYNIIIDNDKNAFNSILDFVDHNDCSLSRLLYLPAAFSRRTREYVMRNVSKTRVELDNTKNIYENSDKNIKITGQNVDFLRNVRLYKELSGDRNISDEDLNDGLNKFLFTSHELIKHNLKVLLKYKVVEPNMLPYAMTSLCGKRTEYLLDRFIESTIFEEYLLPRVNVEGELKPAMGTSLLFNITNPLIFYKIKRAIDIGDSLFRSRGLKHVLTDDKEEYSGISLNLDGEIVQEQISTDEIDVSLRKYLPGKFFPKKSASWEDIDKISFRNLYKYKTFSPTDLFITDKVTGNLIEKIFERDYYEIDTNEEVLNDPFIKLLDNAIYCDNNGNTKSIKTTELQYTFMHPSYPNICVVISRYKVLRLCKLLNDNDCWINDSSSMLEKENILLSIVLKDSIVCEYEMVMLRFMIRKILETGLIKVDNTENINLERRVGRK